MYRCGADGVPQFVEAGSPTDDEVHALLQTIITWLMKTLTRRGVLVQGTGRIWLAEPDADGEEARTLRPLQAAAITYRIAFGRRAGQKVLTLRGGDAARDRSMAAPVRRHRREQSVYCMGCKGEFESRRADQTKPTGRIDRCGPSCFPTTRGQYSSAVTAMPVRVTPARWRPTRSAR